jgi:hypothetical protein
MAAALADGIRAGKAVMRGARRTVDTLRGYPALGAPQMTRRVAQAGRNTSREATGHPPEMRCTF